MIFEAPRLGKPDVRIIALGWEYHVHSVMLKLHSDFFFKFLDSADKPLPSTTKPIAYECEDQARQPTKTTPARRHGDLTGYYKALTEVGLAQPEETRKGEQRTWSIILGWFWRETGREQIRW